MKTINFLSNFVLALIGVVAAFLLVSIFPISGNFKVYVVQSGSMSPAIRTGSVVAVMPRNEYQIGDVITFSNGKDSAPTTHRIYGIKQDSGGMSFITKGDANNSPDDSSVESGAIIGKALFSIPYAGYAVDTVKKPFGFILVIVLPALLMVFDELKKISAEIAKIRKNKISRRNKEQGIIDLRE